MLQRLRCWFNYCVNPKKGKANTSAAPLPKGDATNTFEMFMMRLLGIQQPPRQRHAAYAFIEDHWVQGMNLKKTIDDAWDAWPKESTEKRVNFRSTMVHKVFKTLSEPKRKKYQEQVEAEGDKAKADYKAGIEAGPQKDPLSRAR